MADDTKSGKQRVRSPNFPSLALPDAIKKAATIYEKDKRNHISGPVALEHLGYGKNVSGSAGRVLSAMRQFGLIDDVPNEKYRVSDSAYHIIALPDESKVKQDAVRSAAQRPAVFREVFSRYPDGLPSDSSLREYLLVERGFNPVSIDTFIKSIKSTAEFAKLYHEAYTGGDPEGSEGEPMREQTVSGGSGTAGPAAMPAVMPTAPGVAREVSSLPEGEAILQWPASMSLESVSDLEDWLALVVKKMKRRYAPE